MRYAIMPRSIANELITDGSTTTMGAFMSGKVLFCSVMVLVLSSVTTSAAVPKDMIGTWRWEESTIQVTECQLDRVCAKVIAGPKNVGMEVFATKLVANEGNLFAQVVHPKTKEIYNTRFQKIGPRAWRLDGCTVSRVCLSGEFVRVK